MSIVVSVKDILLANADFAALAPTIYLFGSPLNPDMPNVTIYVVSGSDDMTHSGPDGLNVDMVRLFIKSKTDKQTIQIAKAARKALSAYRGTVRGNAIQLITHRNRNTPDETETGIYRQIDDYRAHYSEIV